MKSLPVAVKVGGAGVLGGGGIAGTGLLIHDQIQKSKNRKEQENEEIYKFKDLDKELIKDGTASLTFSSEANKGDFASVNEDKKLISIAIVASSESNESKFKKDTNPSKWTCVITGFIKDKELKLDSNSKNFDNGGQKTIIQKELTKKDGFVKSCSRNRPDNQNKNDGKLTSEIKVELSLGKGDKSTQYEFPKADIDSIFAGTWENPKQ